VSIVDWGAVRLATNLWFSNIKLSKIKHKKANGMSPLAYLSLAKK